MQKIKNKQSRYFFILVFALIVAAAPVSSLSWTIGFLAGSGGLGDESFNDMTYKGLGRAKREIGSRIVVREWEPSRSMEKLFLQLIQEKADVVVLNGDQFLPLLQSYAPKYPDIYFIANDFNAGPYENVKSIVYSQHEGSFLAGALAGDFSASPKIGFIGAIDIDVVNAFMQGFVEGVDMVAPASRVQVEYISRMPDYSGFNNPKKARRMALDMYRQGVDVIFAVAGLSGNGVIQAAREADKYVIGVDSDQDHMAKGHVLTSVMKRLDIAVYEEVTKAFSQNFVPGLAWYGLQNKGISLTPMRYSRDLIPAETLTKLKKLEQQIISGDVKVTNVMFKNY